MYLLDSFLKKVFVAGALFFFFRFFLWSNFILNLVLILASIGLIGPVLNIIWYFTPKRMIPNLEEKAVLVTGCDTGFGHEFAKKLDSLGILVFAGCLFSEGDGAKALKSSCSNKLKIIQLDVTKEDQVQNALKTVNSVLEGGKEELWAIVNNAGIATLGEVEWTSIEDYQAVLDVNTFGQIRVTKAFLSLLKKSKGRIVNVTSVLSRVSMALGTTYSMSKHAALAFADGLRQELLKWSISVHTIEPWSYKTQILSPDTLMSCVQKLWDKAPEKDRKDYDEEYIDRIKASIQTSLSLVRPSATLSPVIDCLVDATLGTSPKIRYVPGSLDGFLYARAILSLSIELSNFISYIILPSVYKSKSK